MIKFIVKLCVLCLIVIGSLMLCIYLIPVNRLFHPFDYPPYKYKIAVMNNVIEIKPVDTVIIGDSRALAGIDPMQIGNAYSAAIPASTPIEGYYYFKGYLAKHQKPTKVIISYSPSFFEFDECMIGYAARFGLSIFSQFLEVVDIAERLNEDPFKLSKERPWPKWGRALYAWAFFKQKYRWPTCFLQDIRRNITSDCSIQAKQAQARYLSLVENKGFYLFGDNALVAHKKFNVESQEDEFLPSLVIREYLVELLDLCERQCKILSVIS